MVLSSTADPRPSVMWQETRLRRGPDRVSFESQVGAAYVTVVAMVHEGAYYVTASAGAALDLLWSSPGTAAVTFSEPGDLAAYPTLAAVVKEGTVTFDHGGTPIVIRMVAPNARSADTLAVWATRGELLDELEVCLVVGIYVARAALDALLEMARLEAAVGKALGGAMGARNRHDALKAAEGPVNYGIGMLKDVLEMLNA